MLKYRPHIWHLMVLVILVAVGIAALKNKTKWGADVTYALMVGILLSSLIGVAASRGNKQVLWIGFATFGSVYFAHSLKFGTLRPPYLILANLFDHFYMPYGKFMEIAAFGISPSNSTPPIIDWSRQVTNSFAAVLVTILGSLLARFFVSQHSET